MRNPSRGKLARTAALYRYLALVTCPTTATDSQSTLSSCEKSRKELKRHGKVGKMPRGMEKPHGRDQGQPVVPVKGRCELVYVFSSHLQVIFYFILFLIFHP